MYQIPATATLRWSTLLNDNKIFVPSTKQMYYIYVPHPSYVTKAR